MASVDSGVDTGNDSNDSFGQDKNSLSSLITHNAQPSTLNTMAALLPSDLARAFENMNKSTGQVLSYIESSKPFSNGSISIYKREFISIGCSEAEIAALDSEYQNSKPINKFKRRRLSDIVRARRALFSDRYTPHALRCLYDESGSNTERIHWSNALRENRLRLATRLNNVTKVKQFLELGVDPNCADYHFRTPLHISACNGGSEIVKVEEDYNRTRIFDCFATDYFDKNIFDSLSLPLLYDSSELEGHLNNWFNRLLLDRGANPNAKDRVGNTPLHLAVCTNHIDVVTLLLKAGTDANSCNMTGRSPLQLAQSKLRIIQRSNDQALKYQVTSQVIEMLLAFIKKKTEARTNTVDEELLNAFQSRLQVSETPEQVESELQNLLDNLSSLSLSAQASTTTLETFS